MGNTNTRISSYFKNIKLTLLTKKDKCPLKFSDYKNHAGENFVYFKPTKNFNNRVFTLEIFKEKKNTLNTVQLHEIIIDNFDEYNRDIISYNQFITDIDSNEVIFRYDDKMYLKEVVYKVNSSELIN